MSRHAPRRLPLSREPQDAIVEGFTHGGEGVVRLEGKAVFVAGVIPGERVRIRVTDDRKRWARAALLEVLDPSPDRVAPPCPYVPVCGGCDLQHVRPEAQRALKTQVVREQLQRLGGLADPPVADCRAVGPDVGYRTHAQLHADPDGRLGYFRAGSHDVVPVGHCLILAPAAQAVRTAVGDGTGAATVQVRGHDATGAAVTVLHPGPGGLSLPDGDFDVLLAQPDGSLVPMRGDGVLTEVVAGHTFRFDASSFFQVNTAGAEALVAAVLDAVGDVGGALVWDLYAGVGLFALPLAAAGAEVVAVEGHAPATRWLAENAAAADLAVEVVTADVGAFVRRSHADPPDVVVLDPPRTGAGAATAAALAALRPATIVYVACDPAALARDTRTFADAGYRLAAAQPLDLFPMTHHVEAVATFTSTGVR
jgi:tRNA/tmRNA/rRNA uracil-C5-methylase (TrmA/RlmC/RlmD family)